jgi:hypothetical protein
MSWTFIAIAVLVAIFVVLMCLFPLAPIWFKKEGPGAISPTTSSTCTRNPHFLSQTAFSSSRSCPFGSRSYSLADIARQPIQRTLSSSFLTQVARYDVARKICQDLRHPTHLSPSCLESYATL